MIRSLLLLFFLVELALDAAGQSAGAAARVEHLPAFPSRFVKARQIDVWLPEGYEQGKTYPVLYMQDGQNVFDPKTSSYGVAWEADSILARLSQAGQTRPCIVVGIWNTDLRFREYAPAQPYYALPAAFRDALAQERPGTPLSDEFLRFVVQELKPYIDRHYRTRPGRADTFVAGSSMGGLISLYAVLEYPRVFGGAACLSTHWPLSLQQNRPDFTNAMLTYMDRKLPRRHRPRLYFDYGTTTLDARYEPHQLRVDSLMRAHGYDATHWLTRKYEGAAHNEAAWKRRFAVPATFLLAPKPARRKPGQ
ncbi:Putative esterase [Hymenobacter daecheongensis DSM 21074]|uniref:Putative esterase n=1 Tax=Hymenobacter daecheongensis DSM 21074 TaxID=1121955 RepID=A0A1M6DHI7_9BACT|nr:alpha/beta hydrolase-fold protein [Hymenobacter daecheongensis]SHI72746.1 Putative esterase [Hymenobacter daecheongensis DSM 21074]